MSARRTLKHCLTLMGTAMFLGVSLGFAAHAAPLCAGVLNPVLSEKEMESKITALARLKLSLDLELTNGNQSTANETLKADFPRLLADLTRALESSYTPEQIRAKISEEIHKLQNKSKKSTAKEKVVRAEVRELLPNYIFRKRIELPRQVHFNHVFEYIPELNALIYQENNNYEIRKRDIDTGAETVLDKGVRKIHLLPDRKTLISVGLRGEVSSIDTDSGQLTPLKSLPPGNRMYSQVDTSGEMLYVSGDGTLVAYNLKTQTFETFDGIENRYVEAAFGNKVIMTGQKTPVLFDTATGVSQNIGRKRKIPSQFAFASDDGKQIVLNVEKEGFEFYDVDKPYNRLSIAKKEKLAEFESLKRHRKMNGADFIIAKHIAQGNPHGRWEIFSLDNLNQSIFEFLGYESEGGFSYQPEYIKWTPDRRKAAILVRKQDDRRDHQSDFIDLWELQQ